MSVALPAPNGTTTLIGFDGYLSCACATMRSDRAPTSRRAEANDRYRFVRNPSLHADFMACPFRAKPAMTLHRLRLIRQIDLHFDVILRQVSSSPLSQVFASSGDWLSLMLTSCLSNASFSAGSFEASHDRLEQRVDHRLRRRRPAPACSASAACRRPGSPPPPWSARRDSRPRAARRPPRSA